MQYQVPQFIDVEDKIFGPLTLKQFVYIAGGGGIAFLLWRALPFLLALPFMLLIGGFSFSLAFVKVNKKPLIYIIEAAFMYFIHSKLYLWSAQKKKTKTIAKNEQAPQQPSLPTLTNNKLTNLAWSLDINERLQKEEQNQVQ